MKSSGIAVAGIASITLLAACASISGKPEATATLAARSGSAVAGTVSFTEASDGLKIRATITGLKPGAHGFHIHEAGDCSAPDASSAKGHFNPMAKTHAHYAEAAHHGGDLPNLMANAKGEANFDYTATDLTLSGSNGVVGRSVVVHTDPDDYKSQPAGNSGARIACGVIVAR